MARQKKLLLPKRHLIRSNGHITRRDRHLLNQHPSGLLWFTGLSGAGKSTLAHGVEKELYRRSLRAYVLDGDHIRTGVNADLTFSPADRRENLRRSAEIARLLVDAGLIVLAAFISPYQADRAFLRQSFADDVFFEVYVKCSLAECERRDQTGKYRLAREGLIADYTGISAPYEEPRYPNLIIDTETTSIADGIGQVLAFMDQVGLLRPILTDSATSYEPLET